MGLFILLGAGVFIFLLAKRLHEETMYGGGVALIISAIITIAILMPASANLRNKVVVFYETNATNYELTKDEIASYLSREEYAGKLIEGSVEKLGLTSSVGEALREWRNQIVDYNNAIRFLDYWSNHPLTKGLVPAPPGHLKYLIIGK